MTQTASINIERHTVQGFQILVQRGDAEEIAFDLLQKEDVKQALKEGRSFIYSHGFGNEAQQVAFVACDKPALTQELFAVNFSDFATL